uniref:Uncharacterized protein n=1 Tax=Ananas comosus var. bracteatus TaxID=296719 RepID=A0A6V7NM13_ANACO|nr:unnamed protein product [Ananas comosus var. bracteatus]
MVETLRVSGSGNGSRPSAAYWTDEIDAAEKIREMGIPAKWLRSLVGLRKPEKSRDPEDKNNSIGDDQLLHHGKILLVRMSSVLVLLRPAMEMPNQAQIPVPHFLCQCLLKLSMMRKRTGLLQLFKPHFELSWLDELYEL